MNLAGLVNALVNVFYAQNSPLWGIVILGTHVVKVILEERYY